MRNRSQGWKHAKISGHTNEKSAVKNILENPDAFSLRLKPNSHLGDIIIAKEGGLSEKNVPSVLDNSTKSKSDIYLEWSSNEQTRISVKKSLNGQAFLIKPNRFIDGFQHHYGHIIPAEVKEAIGLFFGGHPNINKILTDYKLKKTQFRAYEKNKERLVAETLNEFNSNLSGALLNYFRENASNVFDFVFSRGLASNQSDWATHLWYINLIGENSTDELFNIENLKAKIESNKNNLVLFGTRGGGTTIKLPFGFVQWHQNSMQFHHSYEQIKSLSQA